MIARPRKHRRWRLQAAALLLLAISFATSCNDAGPMGVPEISGVEVAVVVNSVDISVSVFPVDSPLAGRSIGLAQAGSPVSLAARGHLAIVPLGLVSAAAVVDLRTAAVTAIALPDNSGATGAAFINDSIAYVANPNRNSVSVVNVSSGTLGAEIEVGVFPQAIAAVAGKAFVLNAELDANFLPARPGRVSVIDPAAEAAIDTIELSGLNPTAMTTGPDGLLYVVNAGSFGGANGSLSVIDPATLRELEHHVGFGEFPGGIAIDAAGKAYVSSFSYGIAIWDIDSASFVRPPSDPMVVQGHMLSSGVGFDSAGRLYTLIPGDCVAPSQALRLTTDTFDRAIDVGVCPIAIGFARLPE